MVEAMTRRVLSIGAREQAGRIGFLCRFSDQRLTLTDAVRLYVMGRPAHGPMLIDGPSSRS